jgi:hypothetical protein
MESYINHKDACRAAVRRGHDLPEMPSRDVIGDAATLMKHVSIGKKALKGTEEESTDLRKMLYGSNTLYGSHDVWATHTPNDETDAIVGAYAGYTYGPRNPAPSETPAQQDDNTDLNGNEQPTPTPASSLKGYSQNDMAEAVATNPVACARAFRRQVEIYVKHIVGWDLEAGMSNEGIMSLVQAFTIQVEEQFRQTLHGHGIYSLAAAPSTLKAFVDKLNNCGGISVERVINFANDIQCNSVMSNPVFYEKCMVCENEACPAVVAPPPVPDTVMDTVAVVLATPPAAGLADDGEETGVPSTPRPLVSEPIDESILNTTKPLGYNFKSPPTVACDVCHTKYVGHEVLERAALVELEKHGGTFAELVEAWGRGNDAFNVRMEALCIVIDDMEALKKPEYQAVLTLLVLQFQRHRAGHHRSCFKLKIKGTCRFALPQGKHLVTTLIINNMEFDKFGNVIYHGNPSTADGAVATHDDAVPLAAIVVDASTAAVPFSVFPLIQVLKLEDITTMDIVVQRSIGSEYINRYNPVVMITFGWNNDMTTMLTSPGIIHYITNYVSKAPDAGATGAATIRAFKQTVEKRQREDLHRRMEAARVSDASANDTTNPFNMDSPLVDAAPSKQQRSKSRVIATMLAVDRTQEIGQNLVAYTSFYKTTHMHSHEYKSVQVPQMLAYLRGEAINGVMSRVSPLVLPPISRSVNTTATPAEAGLLLFGDDDDDVDYDDDGYEEGATDPTDPDEASETGSTPVQLAAVPQVLKVNLV